ncbi:hypothetical protein ACFPOB_23630 [Bosea eneae]|uniref:Uncharacterized protein n=1 Tax=Bosea eneae TaxID=151454 RepID=A0ABW0IXU2_9HYPH
MKRKPPVKATPLSGCLASRTIGERGLDNGVGRMVCFEPDGGNVRHEAIRVERKRCSESTFQPVSSGSMVEA